MDSCSWSLVPVTRHYAKHMSFDSSKHNCAFDTEQSNKPACRFRDMCCVKA